MNECKHSPDKVCDKCEPPFPVTSPDPRLDEIQAIPPEAVEAAARVMLDNLYSDKTLEVDDEDRDMMRAVLEAAHPVLLAELRKAHEALARVEALHKPVKIYDECDCPDGTHPDEYDYIDCEDYVGCENSLSGVGCQECCVDSWDSLTQECGENHSHSMDPAFRCDTIKALRAAVAAAKGDDRG